MGRRVSEQRHWESFWGARTDPAEVYPDSIALLDRFFAQESPAGLKVLEVGAGSGRDAVALARSGADVTVLDYADNALAHVRENAHRAGVSVRRVRADGRVSPFPPESFDVVLHQGLLEHFREPADLLRENHRVLKPGGRLYCSVPQTFHLYTVLKQLLIAVDRWFAGWETQFTPAKLDACARRAGFQVTGRFGGWMVPSLAYRSLRACLGFVGVDLPMVIRGPRALGEVRGFLRSRAQSHAITAWTYLVVGVVAEKP